MRPRWFTPQIRQVTWIWAIVTIALIVLALLVPERLYGIPPQAAERANDYVLTMKFFTVLSCPVLALVMVFAIYSLYRWRSQGEPATDGPYMVAGKGVQIAWVGISAALVVLLYGWGLVFLNRADAGPPAGSNVLNVDVLGEQWHWNFTYPQYGNAQSADLVVPINRPILFKITSVDVVHSFGIDAFALKQDAVPGQFTYIRVTPNRQGNYDLRCYELCGMFHAYMQSQVRVVPAATFASWVRTQPTGFPWGIGGADPPGTYNPSPGQGD
jgi:cytochrome c oxidase subunit 2